MAETAHAGAAASKPRTYFDKIWDEHFIKAFDEREHLLQIDRLMLHEAMGTVAMRELRQEGRAVASPAQVFSLIDHAVQTKPGIGIRKGWNDIGTQLIDESRLLSRKLGLHFIDVDDARQGIAHVIAPELGIALPGLTVVCPDSHTCTLGGLGVLAWGIGASECKHVLATQVLMQTRPKTMRVNFHGILPPHVYAKDMVLNLISRVGANGGTGHAVQFAGPAVAALPIEARMTLCNMAIEFSAKYGFVAPDDATYEYLYGREFAPGGAQWDAAEAHWRALAHDDGARFDREIDIDCTALEPQVSWGTSPQHVIPISGRIPSPSDYADPGERAWVERALRYQGLEPGTRAQDVRIDAAYIGSCTNARLSDLREAAAVLKGRKVAAGVTAICVPGSTQVKRDAEAEGLDRVFLEAGFEWHDSGCGLCAQGKDRFKGERIMSTTNRNFENRQGLGSRTHLASPATVAASAVTGRMTHVRQLPSGA
ncbi:3-isopropylmalate dehydratase large subunit [Bordetella genomosp. 11]|uniref:3-isopropylmalate dehydratase n=1 Tax=Bordetella genomosp. 11 TaxID=1416808 RepID=A0A261UYF7_9BORD|nr:3-isopropylmalate dehydratase large subunit [Bordetella genomosp. 11]OZI66928.1 3-isopropylmalate dehydratase [Bordetella genomosp. 11]